jgi:hypothetical protein
MQYIRAKSTLLKFKMIKILAAFLMAFAVVACGGGASNQALDNQNNNPSSLILSGVASGGAPLGSANITVLSRNGGIFSATSPTDANGRFSLTLDANTYPGPYLIKIEGVDEGSPTFYAFAKASDNTGILVTPLTTAAIALSVNKNAADVFNNKTAIDEATFTSKINLLFRAASGLFQSAGISSASKLVNDANYIANGSGPDSVLDTLKLNYTNSATGEVLLSGKFASSGRLINATTTSVTPLTISGNLTSGVLSGISSVNTCIVSASAANSSTALLSCLVDSGFKERGATTASTYLAMLNSYMGTLASFRPAVLKWCDFDDATVTLESAASALAGKTGVCLAKVPFTNTQAGTTLYDAYYKFTVNAAGTGVSTVQMLGNQLDGSFNVYPAIGKNIRIDGLTENAGVINSGYRFEINNSYFSGQRYPLSAKVELFKSDNSLITTVYLRCQQVAPNSSATCVDTNLSICTDASCTRTDNSSAAISNANSTVTSQIITALQAGPVKAKMTAYQNANRTGSAFTKSVPINELPIPQSDIAEAVMPTLDTNAIDALQRWDGLSSTLSLGFNPGTAGVRVGIFYSSGMQINVQSQPVRGSGILNLSGIGMSNASPLVTGSTVCPAANKTYRAVTLGGSYRDTPVYTKYFGSCTSGSY